MRELVRKTPKSSVLRGEEEGGLVQAFLLSVEEATEEVSSLSGRKINVMGTAEEWVPTVYCMT